MPNVVIVIDISDVVARYMVKFITKGRKRNFRGNLLDEKVGLIFFRPREGFIIIIFSPRTS